MTRRDFTTELIWILVVAVLTGALVVLMVGFEQWGIIPVKIHFHDTYLVLSVEQVYVWLFLNTAFWIYLVKQGMNRFQRQSGNAVLLLVTGLLIFVCSMAIRFVGSMTSGWTIYPPLSAMPVLPDEPVSYSSRISVLLQGYQLFLIAALALVGIRIGRGMRKV